MITLPNVCYGQKKSICVKLVSIMEYTEQNINAHITFYNCLDYHLRINKLTSPRTTKILKFNEFIILQSKTTKGHNIKANISCLLFGIIDLTRNIMPNHQSRPQHHSHLLQQSDIGSHMTPAPQLPCQQLFLIALIHVVKEASGRI